MSVTDPKKTHRVAVIVRENTEGEYSIEAVLADGQAPRTADLGGRAGTADVGRAIAHGLATAPASYV